MSTFTAESRLLKENNTLTSNTFSSYDSAQNVDKRQEESRRCKIKQI